MCIADSIVFGGHYFTVESSFIYHLEETAGGREAGGGVGVG